MKKTFSCIQLLLSLMQWLVADPAWSQGCVPDEYQTFDLACIDPLTLLPESGWWWTPQLPGSGFNLEYQRFSFDGRPGYFMFGSVFAYDDQGQPEWLTFAGELVVSERWWEEGAIAQIQAPLYRTNGGQQLGGSHLSPDAQEDPRGPVTLTFEAPNRGTLSLEGAQDSRPIRRHVWGRSIPAQGIAELEGNWVQWGVHVTSAPGSTEPRYVITARNARIRPPQSESEIERLAFMQLEAVFPGQQVMVEGEFDTSWAVYHQDPDTGEIQIGKIAPNDEFDTLANLIFRLLPLSDGVFLGVVAGCQSGCYVGEEQKAYEYMVMFRSPDDLDPLHRNLFWPYVYLGHAIFVP